MTIDKKNKILIEYMRQCPLIDNLYAIFTKVEDGAMMFEPQTSETLITYWIDGRAYKKIVFTINNYISYSTNPVSSNNIYEHENLLELEDMLDNIKMKEDFEKLIGVRDEKPFECIGTKDEVNAAMSLILEKDEYKNNENLPLLIKYYKDECQNKHMNKDQIDKILNSYETNNNVTRETTEKIKKLLGIL